MLPRLQCIYCCSYYPKKKNSLIQNLHSSVISLSKLTLFFALFLLGTSKTHSYYFGCKLSQDPSGSSFPINKKLIPISLLYVHTHTHIYTHTNMYMYLAAKPQSDCCPNSAILYIASNQSRMVHTNTCIHIITKKKKKNHGPLYIYITPRSKIK